MTPLQKVFSQNERIVSIGEPQNVNGEENCGFRLQRQTDEPAAG
jgi:hypothetical protein